MSIRHCVKKKPQLYRRQAECLANILQPCIKFCNRLNILKSRPNLQRCSYNYHNSLNYAKIYPDSKGSRGHAWFRHGKPVPWHATGGPDRAQAWLPYPWYRSDCPAWARSVCHGHAMPMASTILPGLGPVSLPVLCHWHFEF